MKRRMISAILTLCMLLALLPTALFPVAAETGSQGASSQSTVTSYLDLYVGANGSTTENGGRLTVLLSAFKGFSSLNMNDKIWANVAKGATQNATFAGDWTAYENGGVGFDLSAWDNDRTLSMDVSLLPTDTYTLEIVSSVRGLTENADGVTPKKDYQVAKAGLSLGRLRGFLWCGDHESTRLRDKNGMIVMYTENPESASDGWSALCATAPMSNNAIAPHREDTSIVNMTVNLTFDANYYYYEFLKNGSACQKDAYFNNKCAKAETPYVGSFILNRSIPGTMYAVRLYTKPLTAAELKINRAVDILLNANAPFSLYMGIPEADRDDFLSLVAKEDFTATTEDIQTIVENLAQLRAEEAALRAKNAYDELYIGADGSKTQNGGRLTVLLSAYKPGSLAFTETKNVWYDKMGNHDATLVGSLWKLNASGGVGYDMNVLATDGKLGTYKQEVQLNFGIDALPKEDFTLEYVVQYKNLQSVDAEGNVLGDFSGSDLWGGVISDAVGQLKNIYDRSEGTSLSGRRYCRWFLAPAEDLWYKASYQNEQLWYDNSRNDSGVFTQQIVRDVTKEQSKTLATYALMKNGTAVRTGKYDSSTPSSNKSDTFYTGAGSETMFFLFHRSPVNVYTVRIYDAVLTEYEMAYNHLVDLLAYADIDLSILSNMDAETVAFMADTMKTTALTKDKEALEATIRDTQKLYQSNWNKDTSLYVTDGLTVLLSSYDGFSTTTRFGDTEVIWANAVKSGTFGTLVGSGWKRSETGGLQMRDVITQLAADSHTVTQYRAEHTKEFYLSLDYGLLPEGDYTIETILTPEGIMVEDDDGNLSPYYDDYTTWGIYHDYTFVLGALRCMGFVCNSQAPNANMQRRWVYQKTGCWGSGRYEVGTDNVLANRTEGAIVNYTITHDRMEEENEENLASVYTVTLNGARGWLGKITNDTYIAKEDVLDKRFNIWRYLGGTYYSVRVYDRLLTEDEVLQNHVADVCYYLGLDTSVLEETLAKIPDKSTVFKAFAHFDFTMTKEQAQSDLDNGMAGIWVQADGVGVKTDMSDVIRFYFTLQYSSIAAIMQAGFSVELGALLNVDSGDMPALLTGAYDYRFVAFDSISGANKQYFLDEDTFAITLSYADGNIDLYNQSLKIVSYVKLTAEDGKELVFYGGFAGKAYNEYTSLFSVMKYLSKRSSILNSELADYVSAIAEDNYYEYTVYFDSNADGAGDGSEENPYTDFKMAFAACNRVLTALDRPTNVRLVIEGGVHSITELVEFDFDEITYPYYYYTIEGNYLAAETPELTTTLGINSANFAAVAGKPGLYVYQFEPDDAGNYPAFRYLYVDGMLATRSHTTPTTTSKGERPYELRYDRDLDGTYLLAKYYFDNGVLAEHSPEIEYASRPERTDLIASYTEHYNQFMTLGGSYEMPAVDEEARPGRFYVQLDMIEALSAITAERLAALKENKDFYVGEVARLTAVVAEKQSVYNAAKADYEAKLEKAGEAGATDEDRQAYLAAKSVMEAALAVLEASQKELADTEEMVYDVTASYKTCLKGLGIEMHAAAEWCFNIMHVDGIDFDDVVYHYDSNTKTVETLVAVYLNKTQYAKFAIGGSGGMANRLYSIQNAQPFVDEEGEYYYDEETGKLYFFTAYDIEEQSFSYPTLDNLFVFHNSNNLVISDLTFWGVDEYALSRIGLAANQAGQNGLEVPATGVTWFSERAAIAIHNTNNTTIQDCYFHDLGGSAIYLQGKTQNSVISGNEIENVGDAGIRARGSYAPWGGNRAFSAISGVENVVISQNYLHDVARVNYASVGIYLPSCKDVEIANNTVIGTSYSAMSIGWSWSAATWEEHEKYNLYNVDIHHNYVTDFMQELGDGGAIYMLGGNLKPDNPKQINFIHHNVIICSEFSGNGRGEFTACYYFDGSSTNWSNYNNIGVRHSAGADRGASAKEKNRDYYLYMRHKATHMVYMQLQKGSESYNIHSYNNYYFNVRATTAAKQQSEVFVIGSDYAKRGHEVYSNYFFSGDQKLSFSNSVKRMFEEAGSTMRPADWGWLIGNAY